MPFLWAGGNHKIQKYNKRKEPSPTHQIFSVDSARSPQSDDGCCRHRFFPICRHIERASLFTFFCRKVNAGMTVEASVLLPLFLFFVLNLSCAIELIRLHGNLQLALWETGSRLAIYGHALEDSSIASLFSYFYVREQVIAYAGEDYLDSSPITKGAQGLVPWESNIFSSGDEIDLIVTYQVSPWSSFAGFGSFRMANRFYAHIWNGFDITNSERELREREDIVYMTENGEVYHEDRYCTHLELSVQETTRAAAESQTNQWGQRYSPCEKCQPEAGDLILYITDEGNRYHSDRGCSGLKRTVFSVSRSQVSDYRACSRCSR